MKRRPTPPITQRRVLAGIRKPMPPQGAVLPSKKDRQERRRLKKVDLRGLNNDLP